MPKWFKKAKLYFWLFSQGAIFAAKWPPQERSTPAAQAYQAKMFDEYVRRYHDIEEEQ